ncbi:coronin [Gregarina niphandrodes]|uniref:Coronin n=1 Tax=Gregarina niphandrodes TaxID=110365 RepID=A0A023B018_GRENI|nr:coronin [Gregarina niphandrodes]EZG43899.1 coronin [Gregarina niphandrodes]|eukprot:XP_011132925.1 coronin [Gregarina niphandrodes]
MAHAEGVTDIQHSPFHSDLVATVGAGGGVQITKLCLSETSITAEAAWSASAHDKKCLGVSWNPVADHVLATTSMDKTIKIWDVDEGKSTALKIETVAPLWNMDFLQNGKLICGMGQDNVCRLFDARAQTVAAQSGPIYKSTKPCQCIALPAVNDVDASVVVTVGFEDMGKRYMKIFDVRDLAAPIVTTKFPGAAANTQFHWVPRNNLLFVTSRGDVKVSALSIGGSSGTDVALLPEYSFPKQAGYIGFMPETSLDVMHTEVARCYRTEMDTRTIRQTSFHCGKIDEGKFQPAYYKPYTSYTDPISADYWFNGGDAVPKAAEYRPIVGSQVALEPAKQTKLLKWDGTNKSKEPPLEQRGDSNAGEDASDPEPVSVKPSEVMRQESIKKEALQKKASLRKQASAQRETQRQASEQHLEHQESEWTNPGAASQLLHDILDREQQEESPVQTPAAPPVQKKPSLPRQTSMKHPASAAPQQPQKTQIQGISPPHIEPLSPDASPPLLPEAEPKGAELEPIKQGLSATPSGLKGPSTFATSMEPPTEEQQQPDSASLMAKCYKCFGCF